MYYVGSSSEYRVNGVVMTSRDYIAELAKIGVLAKTKNFLVYQVMYESIGHPVCYKLNIVFAPLSWMDPA